MPLTLQDHDVNIEHAKWRVQFVRSLLETHSSFPFHSAQREAKEAALIAKLAAAERELESITAMAEQC